MQTHDGFPFTDDEIAQITAEGWCISNDSSERTDIQRLDDADVFFNDALAVYHVFTKAREGSELHRRALAYTITTQC